MATKPSVRQTDWGADHNKMPWPNMTTANDQYAPLPTKYCKHELLCRATGMIPTNSNYATLLPGASSTNVTG